jgi:hypothetical protein
MVFDGLKRKIKWLTILVIILIVVVMIVKFTRCKAWLVDFIHREDGLATAVDALNGKGQDAIALVPKEVDFSERLAPVRPRRKVKATNQTVKVDSENQTQKQSPGEVENQEPENAAEEIASNETPHAGRGPLPRRKNSKTSNYKREELCRKILEDYFDDYFPTCRPKFLSNPKTGYPLELDAYNPRLNLSMEVQGKQHRVFPNYFHKSREEFDKQQERDAFKRQRLAELGIDLIEVDDRIPTNQLEAYIHGTIKQLGK